MKKYLLATLASLPLIFSCKSNLPSDNASQMSKGDWITLFDGKDLSMWKGWKKDKPGDAWQIKDGTLYFNPKMEDKGDLMTRDQFQDFDLRLDWKIQECGNSGIMYNVQESEEFHAPYSTGPEMQILDNACHPDGKIIKHRAGDLYDMIETSVANVKPAGQWNSIRIISKNGKVTFWQNEAEVVRFEMFGDEWNTMIDNSKFKGWKGFGAYKKGHIALQDHGNEVWFRNIKIKTL